jgi:hypothetical protein
MKLTKLIIATLMLTVGAASHAQQDTVTRDPSNGDWVYTLHNPDDHNQQYVWRYTPRNQVVPKIKSVTYWDGKNFVYRYTFRNGNQAKQALAFVWLRAPIVITAETGGILKPIRSAALPESEYVKLLDKFLDQKDILEKKTLISPKDWYSKWNIANDDFTEFGWFPSGKNDSNLGVAVGKTVTGFGILRPELPGVMFAKTKGATDSRIMMGDLPKTGPIADAAKTMEDEDPVWTPVMVPAIVIPQPYNGAELARRIKAHTNYWLKLGLITQDTLDRLNRSFDSLINAQTYNNLAGTDAAVREILKEAYSHHRGLDHNKNEEDEDEHDAEPVKRKSPANVPLNRVAARALSFDLTYLLTRAYTNK